MKNLKIVQDSEIQDWVEDIFKKNSFNMIDVSSKNETFRRALASGKIYVGREVFELIKNDRLWQYNIFTSLTQGCPFILNLENNNSRANCGNNKKTEEFESIISSNDTTIIFGGRIPWYFNGDSFETNLGTSGDDIEPRGRELLDRLEAHSYTHQTLPTNRQE